MNKIQNIHFNKKTVRDIEVHNKRILLRVDFNVPLNKQNGSIASDFRIQQSLPTIEYLLKRNAELIIVSHLGRPEGKVDQILSLEQVAKRLSELIKKPVEFVSDCASDVTVQAVKKIKKGTITLLENVRFYPGEEANDLEFAKKLIQIIQPDYIVHDEFGAIHRAHASTEGISHLVPAVAGLLLEKEVVTLKSAIDNPYRPLVAVLGGAKISDKLPLVERFLQSADTILIGGAMANNFIKANGHQIGKSLIDKDGTSVVSKILNKAKPNQIQIPIDVAVGKDLTNKTNRRDCKLNDVDNSDIILDLGPETMSLYLKYIASAGTVIWNGNLGMTELPKFAKSSEILANQLSGLNDSVETIIGGGDTADFVLNWLNKHPKGHFSHISTGGGASLELLSGEKLPGVEALLNA